MRVLIVNTNECKGGAAIAAGRLMKALCNNGVKAKMLVCDKEGDNLTVCTLPGKWSTQWHFLWERFVIWMHLHLQRQHLFDIDIANVGTDITKLPEFKEADIIHLHWVNQGMLSLKGIRKILDSGKPVVWTMHDMWPATAICHLTLDCRCFETGCHHCPLLPGNGSAKDLSAQVWRRKQRMFEGRQVAFVACSQWLAGEASKSALLQGQEIYSIPNPLDTHCYHPQDKQQARRSLGLPEQGRIILFASQRVTNVNKGMSYLMEACRLVAEEHGEMVGDVSVVILGGHAEEIVGLLPFKTYPLGYVNDEQRIVQVYNASDVFVLPSLSENLPNTIMEAMACGVPCIGFRVGGIPEEIDHLKTGYVADYKSAADLARGLYWALAEADSQQVAQACVSKVVRCYSQAAVANSYNQIYESYLHRHHHL